MQFSVNFNYKNRVEGLCQKYKKITPVFNVNTITNMGFELGNREVLVFHNNGITDGREIYSFKQIKKVVSFTDGLLIIFKDNKFVFLPVTDNEFTDKDLLDIAHFLFLEMKMKFHIHSRLYVINYESNKQKRKRITFEFSHAPIVVAIVSIIIIFIGLFISAMPSSYIPVSREKCIVYTGRYESFEKDEEDYIYIYFKNGDEQWIDCSCYSSKLYTKIAALKEGEKLEILLHPDNEYIVELVSNGEELLNLEFAQKVMCEDVEGMEYMGYVIIIAGVIALIYGISRFVAERPKNTINGEASFY